MSPADIMGVAAHLHVLLRRKTGRVTDTEWMATNDTYAREIVRFAREKATSEGHADLLPWADKLEAACAQMNVPVRVPLVQSAMETLRAGRTVTGSPRTPATGGFVESTLNSVFGSERGSGDDPADPEARYIGRLR
jgi:hypothetical protein